MRKFPAEAPLIGAPCFKAPIRRQSLCTVMEQKESSQRATHRMSARLHCSSAISSAGHCDCDELQCGAVGPVFIQPQP